MLIHSRTCHCKQTKTSFYARLNILSLHKNTHIHECTHIPVGNNTSLLSSSVFGPVFNFTTTPTDNSSITLHQKHVLTRQAPNSDEHRMLPLFNVVDIIRCCYNTFAAALLFLSQFQVIVIQSSDRSHPSHNLLNFFFFFSNHTRPSSKRTRTHILCFSFRRNMLAIWFSDLFTISLMYRTNYLTK